jgi:glycerophosphoryl diester phosphodiesterase
MLLGGCSSAAEPGAPTGTTSSAATGGSETDTVQYTAAQFLALDARPIVIGHEGAGENFGSDPTKPINDTIASVALAYAQGASVVEVDAELTKDGQVVAYHDFDFLPDNTCINSYTLGQLQAKVPYIPTLDSVLRVARFFNHNSPTLSGIMVVEMKTRSPLCDPDDVEERPFVSAIVNVIHQTRMDAAVILDGFSPALDYLAQQMAPSIPRELDLDLLQLLTPAQVTAATGLTVTPIQKQLNLGLQWADVGPIYRLPGYSSVQQFFQTAVVVGASIIDGEQDFIATSEQQQPGSVAQFVGAAHALGFKAYADPAKNVQQFGYYASFGFDGAYCDDIPASLALQPPL